MSTQKQLPDNLKQLEQKPRFKQVYKQHTVEQLEEKLIEAEVEYETNDNKAALTWRFMDAKGMDFDNQNNDKPAANVAIDNQPTEESADHANNDVSTEQTPQDDDSKAGDDADNSEQPSAANEQAGELAADHDSLTDKPVEESADNVESNPPVSTNDDSAPTGNGSGQEQPNDDDKQTKPPVKDDADKPSKSDADYIEVTNKGAYNFYETATGTMVKARETTKIYATATIDKTQILRNIEQYNHTRGNKLHVKK